MKLSSKAVLLTFGGMAGAMIVALGTLFYLATREIDVEFTQDPNSVEAYEARRKLTLFDEAQCEKRKGFVRLSEVEINSFLKEQPKTGCCQTNLPVRLLKTTVQLQPPKLTVYTTHAVRVFRWNLLFMWQRTFLMAKTNDNWRFNLRSMRLGQLEIPQRLWPAAQSWFGSGDAQFDEREHWLAKLPAVSLTHNEMSKLPELRLYTYVPDRWYP